MSSEQIKYNLVDNIMSYLKYQLFSEIEEHHDKMTTFNNVLKIMIDMNKDNYSYTLKDIDDKLFDKLIIEILKVLK